MTEYPGRELELFAFAENWKQYFASQVRSSIHGRVLEVGAGIGGTTKFLCTGNEKEWICLEPDQKLAEQLRESIKTNQLPANCQVIEQTTAELASDHAFNTIIYIDVLEHIQNDRNEILNAFKLLDEGGILIVVSPAHQWLYSPFDKAIGHYRRYTKKTLRSIIPDLFEEKKLLYLDSLGLMASLMNKVLLQQSYPTKKQIVFWDQYIIPASTIFDYLTRTFAGRSILGIWEKRSST